MTIADIDEGNLTKSFAGLRVLDFSTTIAGPHCARMLADMGAEVIKIESAEGETMRTRPPVRNGCSTVFGQLNVGKKSLVLDLKSPDAIEIIRRLVATADILVENFRPGVMRRLKLDYGSLQTLNPGLIYCSISGYGQTGPSAELPAYAPVIHAASGYDMAHLSYQPGDPAPITAASITPMCSRESTHSERFRRRCTSVAAASKVSTSTFRCWNRCSA
jgi:crotonobetainyl-CoA:carnitine CoA-transferase CaiB-like acyl-CoA transferase